MKPLLITGPCAVESEQQILDLARELKSLGITHLRAGAYKPRTSPKNFQGLGKEGLCLLAKAKKETNMKIVTELVAVEHINDVVKVADILQIGARNMQNFELLKQIAIQAPNKNVLLKRGMSATKKELLGAIDYLTQYGHKAEIIICERGIRTFANGEYDRFTLDCAFIADLKRNPNFTHKIIVDPSHPAGRADIVANLAYAGIAAGADGFIIEVKREQDTPLSDAAQAITITELKSIIENVQKISKIVDYEKP